MRGGGVIEKSFTRFQWLSRCMSSIQSIQFAIAGLSRHSTGLTTFFLILVRAMQANIRFLLLIELRLLVMRRK